MMRTIFYSFATFFLFSFQNFDHLSLIKDKEDPKPIVLKTLDEVVASAPVILQNRLEKLSTVKKELEKLPTEKRSHIVYWQQNHIIRWNEFIRELVASYNVAPRCFPDSSGYPTPRRESPNSLPRYPFANPPYASRVFAYTSVAQHDALLTAHFYQKKYEKDIIYSKTNGSTYLPDEAVIAGATIEVLSFLFPGEVDNLSRKGEMVRQSTLFKGNCTLSEVETGFALGKSIGQKIVELAKNDGMDASNGTETKWQEVINSRTQLGELTWKSIQRPVRASIEPFFGNVKPWFFTDITLLRPSPPPSTHSKAIKEEAEYVKHESLAPNKQKMDIAAFWSDPEFSYTPVGHWNQIACTFLMSHKSDDIEKVRTLATLNRAMMDAAIVCWEAKTYYCYPRPTQIDKTIHNKLPLPNFPSYPSGHSTFSGAASSVLSYFFPTETQKFTEMAEEASVSRIYAALHFKMDCEAGMIAGKKVGELAIKSLQ